MATPPRATFLNQFSPTSERRVHKESVTVRVEQSDRVPPSRGQELVLRTLRSPTPGQDYKSKLTTSM
jgi:hypothetical protein